MVEIVVGGEDRTTTGMIILNVFLPSLETTLLDFHASVYSQLKLIVVVFSPILAGQQIFLSFWFFKLVLFPVVFRN